MSENVLTVKQEVEALLRHARSGAQERVDYIGSLGVAGVDGFHADVLFELDKIIEAYVNPPSVAVEKPRGFQIGDKVRITGSGFTRLSHGVQAGDVVTITGPGDGEFGDAEATFTSNGDKWYVYTEGVQPVHEFEDWGGRLLTAEEQEIKVGDTVRILPLYGELLFGTDQNKPGVEFTVTGVSRATFDHPHMPRTSNFWVNGDPAGRGVWEAYIEKVYA